MRRRVLAVCGTIAALALSLAWMWNAQSRARPSTGMQQVGEPVTSVNRPERSRSGIAVEGLPLAPPAASRTAATAATTSLPREFTGFWDGTSEERHQQLQAIAGVTRHPADVIAFLRAALADPRADATLRNHLANILAVEAPRPAGLLAQLQQAALDPTQDLLWRDYAVQHVAVLAATGEDASSIITWLLRVTAEGTGSQKGTALIHAARIAKAANLPLPADFPLTATRLAQGSQDVVDTRIAALGTIGEQGLAEQLPEVRAIAFGETDPSLIAAAIGCASRLGEAGGENWIADFLHHQNPVVRHAAEQAVARLHTVVPARQP